MELEYKQTNAYMDADEQKLNDIFNYSKGYIDFLNNSKTEREAVRSGIKMAESFGYTPYALGERIQPGQKLYYNNRNKSLFLIKAGSENIAKNGIRILVAHVDSPRLDLKQSPLFEESELAFFKTHYYGGIKKYQWLTIPLALHGVLAKKDGSVQSITIGEDPTDPVFYITDLLPHLSQEIVTKTVTNAFPAENLNILVGGIPVKSDDDKIKNATKKRVLELLNQKYGITEADFLSAEIEAVPAYQAREVGFDRSFISSYGHDDRVCAYPEMTALFETETNQTVLTILADKEEIGSEGATGMQCELITDLIDMIAASYKVNPAVVRANSKCLSADVTAAFDPTYSSAFEKTNSCYINHGVAMSKFTGHRGKVDSNDASAEYVAYLRNIFDNANVIWQMGELGKVDLGGGGTVAMYLSKHNIDTVDLGVPVLSMHAPNELISKADIYEAHRAFSEFIK